MFKLQRIVNEILIAERTETICGNSKCRVSIDELTGLSFGSRTLDNYGHFEHPCKQYAHQFEIDHLRSGKCRPFSKVDNMDQGCKDCGKPTTSPHYYMVWDRIWLEAHHKSNISCLYLSCGKLDYRHSHKQSCLDCLSIRLDRSLTYSDFPDYIPLNRFNKFIQQLKPQE